MVLLRRRKIDTIDEKRIVTGMIASTSYMHKVYPLIHENLAYFQTNYTETVAKWAIKYYEIYEEVPFKHIQDEFNMNRSRLSEEDSDMIHDLLVNISKEFEVQGSINVEYLVDQTERWCKLRELEITTGNAKVLLESGDIHGAEQEISRFKKVQIQQSSIITGETLFGEEDIYHTFQDHEETFFRMPGRLGQFLGNFERGWLVGLSGAFKRGKTWLAQEFAVMAMLSYLKVAFFSLEMNDVSMKQRIRKRLVSAGDKKGTHVLPVFDCRHNQTGECNLSQRTQRYALIVDDGKLPEFDKDSQYRVCTACRDTNRQNYEAATWFETMEIPKFEPLYVSQKLRHFDKMYSHLIRLKTYPRFTANVADITYDLNIMDQDGFLADVIIIDYADILKPEDDIMEGIQKEDRTWIALAQLASERMALVIAPTQVTKAALEANILKESHTARWIGKLGHVDVMLAISQGDEEKLAGRSRLSIMSHRHMDYSPSNTITLLQKIALGQVHLDSDFIREVRT
jgi:hypothetical protein